MPKLVPAYLLYSSAPNFMIGPGNNKLCWYMGVKERHEYENTYFPTLFPLRAIRKKHGIMAAAGGPLFGQAANEFDLNGVIALWK